MNQYQNYLGYQAPTYNPYMDMRMQNLQQFQQSLNQPMVTPQMTVTNQQFTPLGKMVEGVDIVKVTDIPMDGNMYYFPKADGTEIYTKQFGVDGKTRILTFKPISDEDTNNLPLEVKQEQFETFNTFLRGIQDDIKALSDKVDKISKPVRGKKEVIEDE